MRWHHDYFYGFRFDSPFHCHFIGSNYKRTYASEIWEVYSFTSGPDVCQNLKNGIDLTHLGESRNDFLQSCGHLCAKNTLKVNF